MQPNDFLRFALVLSDKQAVTFRRNLANIIKLILFENYGKSLSINEIISQSHQRYNLEFSDIEVERAIQADKNRVFIVSGTKHNTNYSLSPNEYGKLSKREDQSGINQSILRFLKSPCGECCGYNEQQLKDLIIRYMYEVFNSDINTVLSLMNYRGKTEIYKGNGKTFSNNEIEIINSFLNWDDDQKNKQVFELVSSCYEYCMMTVKKDDHSFNSLFRGKLFYLDTNVIYRLSGFNSVERKTVIKSFIDKCLSCGVELRYTNFTSQEIEDTIHYRVCDIKRLLHSKQPIKGDALLRIHPEYDNINFYEQYVQWTTRPENTIGDYQSFEKSLRKRVHDSLEKAKQITFTTYNTSEKETTYNLLCKDLMLYKQKKYKNTNDKSVRIDIENYLFMQQQSKQERGSSFMDKKSYFITADHPYIDWTREKTPGTIPTFVLPSVWYSILLKFVGRSTDDYTAFCQFLNLRKSVTPGSLEMLKNREAVLRAVLNSDEPSDVKEEMLFEISESLKASSVVAEADIPSIISTAHSKVVDRRVEMVQVQHNAEKQTIQKQHISDRDNAYVDGKEKGTEETLVVLSRDKAKLNKMIRTIVGLVALISIIIIISIVIAKYNEGKGKIYDFTKFLNENNIVLAIISGGGTLIFAIMKSITLNTDFLSTDEAVILKKYKRKLKKI